METVEEPGGATIRLSKLQTTILSTLLAAVTIAIGTNLFYLNDSVRSLAEWRTRLDAQDSILKTSLARNEWLLEKQLIDLKLEQMRSRLDLLEKED